MADQTVARVTSDWFRFFLEYNPADYWEQVDVPILALFGELDVQVDSGQNAPALEAVLERARTDDYTIVIFPTANHLFQDAVTGSISEYGDLTQEFVPDFLPTITDWLLERVEVLAA